MSEILGALTTVVVYLEVIALFLGALFAHKYWSTHIKIFLPYLLLVVLMETIIPLIMDHNHIAYNILGAFETVVYFYLFFFACKKKKNKRIITFLASMSITALIINYVYFEFTLYKYLNYGWALCGLSTACSALIYIRELVQTEKVLYLKEITLFWISIGLILYQLCSLPIITVVHVLPDISPSGTLYIIQSLSAIVLYLCIILGFTWGQKNRTF